MSIKQLVRSSLKKVLQDYRINVIVASPKVVQAPNLPDAVRMGPITPDIVQRFEGSKTAKIVSALSYERSGLRGMVLSDELGPQCVAHFAAPDQYDFASIWPISASELSLVNIATEQSAFGKGYAPLLIRAAAARYLGEGFDRISAFIWWSNTPSRRAFQKAGWRTIGHSLEAKLFGRWFSLRLPF